MNKKNEQDSDINSESQIEQNEDLEGLEIEVESSNEKDVDSDTKGQDLKIKELNDKYLRLYAEFENYKKRTAKEKQEILKFGSESLMFELLTVIDHLELALNHASEADSSSDSLYQGVDMTLKELLRALEKFGLKRVDALGKPFDPAFHEAMSQMERNDIEAGQVVDEFRSGYIYNEKLLRPSLVAVSKRSEHNADSGRKALEESEIVNTDKVEKEEKDNG